MQDKGTPRHNRYIKSPSVCQYVMNKKLLWYRVVYWDFGILGYWNIWILGNWDFRISGYWDIRKLGYRDIGILGYWLIGKLGYQDIGILRCWNIGIQ